MRRLLILTMLALGLASCQVLRGGDDGGSQTSSSSAALIQWQRSPDTIVFRAEVTGGEDANAFYMRNDVPYCTIYGDNRIVWNVINSDNNSRILFDRLPDGTIQRFVEDLTIAYRIYDYSAGIDLQPASQVQPVVERITLNVNDRVHITDAFGGWDYLYFLEIVDRCQALSQSPVIFEPTEAWISVSPTTYDPNTSSVLWDANAAGLDLAELAASGERRWITGRNVRVIWNVLRTSALNVQFEQPGATFVVALEVPGVTAAAPPRPAN